MTNIVIPMAGLGSRFSKVGYDLPKPLIDVAGKPMINRVIDNLSLSKAHRFIFVCQNVHLQQFQLEEKLKSWAPNSIVIGIDGVTEGACCTVLTAQKYIDSEDPLIIANCDQYIDADFEAFAEKNSKTDGCIMTMQAEDNKWSYAKSDSNGYVTEVREKVVISNEATVGIYGFHHGKDFCEAAMAMIEANDRVNNEFYVAPVYNYLVSKGKKISLFNIGSLGEGMHGIGTPDDLKEFLERKILQ